MPQCEAIKKDGERCNGVAKPGNRYCHYHRKRFTSASSHGLNASPEMLGIPQNKSMTFSEFYNSEKPFELLTELAYLRTMLVEQREAMEATRPDFRAAILHDFHQCTVKDLMESGVSEKVSKQIAELLKPRLEDIIREYHGPVEPLSPAQYSMLGDTIERISRVADKAKRIADGITLNVDFGATTRIIVKFVREVVLREVQDPHQRARIVERVRGLNLGSYYAPEPSVLVHQDDREEV